MIPAHISLSGVKKWCEVNAIAYLGIEITEIGTDYICGTMPVDHRTQQPVGILHGGMSVVLAESLGSIASNLIVEESGKVAVGLEVNANHVSSVKEGLVKGRATLVHAGSKTHIWDIRITNDKDKLVCISRLTIAILDKK
ncbi:MAG: hypothetical protein JWM14_289 [Chitinophagaceae bacterium]|nr:hypothetical protein [Chitinophagaceae bacterium]